MTTSFTIKLAWRKPNLSFGGNFRVQVVVYETVGEMIEAARKLRPDLSPAMSNSLALFQSTPLVWRVEDSLGTGWGDPENYIPGNRLVGTIRFVQEHLITAIIVHECTHAALSAYRRYIAIKPTFGEDDGLEVEEQLCYLVGELSEAVTLELHRLGLL